MMQSIRSLGVSLSVAYVLLWFPGTAQAQFGATPFEDPATGEKYHVEGGYVFWNPPLDLKVASASLGLAGTKIDATTDLGLANKHLSELRIVLRPARKHKFRIQYLPMKYSGQTNLHRNFVFNGQNFGVNLPIVSDLEWTTWLIAYEYDFLYQGPVVCRLDAELEVHQGRGDHRQPGRRRERDRAGTQSRRSAVSGACTWCRISPLPAS